MFINVEDLGLGLGLGWALLKNLKVFIVSFIYGALGNLRTSGGFYKVAPDGADNECKRKHVLLDLKVIQSFGKFWKLVG